jgi:hypothetical protein
VRKVSIVATPEDDLEPDRAQLERVAFGRAETPAQVAAAHEALRQLVDADAAKAEAARAAAVEEYVPEPDVTEHFFEEPEVPQRRRSLIPLLVVAGLFAGALTGVLVTRADFVASTPAAEPTAVATPEPTPDPAAALKSMMAPQTAADKQYPFLHGTTPGAIQPASIHRVLIAADGATLWVGRSDSGICMMWSRPDVTDSGIAGAATCASPSEFGRNGLTLSEGVNAWSWNGIDFTEAPGP